jgi:hypothetical protein
LVVYVCSAAAITSRYGINALVRNVRARCSRRAIKSIGRRIIPFKTAKKEMSEKY